MSKPIVFQPGDVLTAEQINKYLLEDDGSQQAALDTRIAGLVEQIETKINETAQTTELAKVLTTGGRPTYDYENL
ncbi:hypothetical protein [uncultured Mobiluncus sp.]|uniref:hypothetical protein n=1 Tax=uncultured Mobiluncus sp. TaxID=293425 RepID=UPI0026330649|nr:hypothetical protein [uncultured Mobiluncus sp.]